MNKLKNGDVVVAESLAGIVYVADQFGWVCDGALYMDRDRLLTMEPMPPTITKTAFKMLFSPAEYEKSRQMIDGDQVIKVFWSILDDPETKTIDLSDNYVQQGIAYVLEKLKESDPDIDVDARTKAIISGVRG